MVVILQSLLLSHFAGILINHKLFVFGGTGFPFAEVRNNVMYCCDLTSLKWDIFQCSGTLPEKVYGHVSDAHKLQKGNLSEKTRIILVFNPH